MTRLLILSILTVITLSGAFADKLEVCSTCNYTTIKSALMNARDGDTILIKAGFYKETDLSIDKEIVVKGEGKPVIDGGITGEIMIINADHVTVEGIEFRNAGKSHIKDLAAIRVKRKNHFTIRNNYIFNAFFGIYIEHGKYGLIEDNRVAGNARDEISSGNAIHCWYAEHVTIRNNYLSGQRDGIYLEFVNHSDIQGNVCEKNIRYGLHFMFSNDDNYSCNTFRKNGAGVAVMFSKRINMNENIFENNWGQAAYGLLLKEIYDAEISGNLFLENTIGIFLEGSTRIQYYNNTFKGNGWAVQLSGGCLDNKFSLNNFTTNTLDLVVNSRVNNNTFDQNYWSDYTGYDLDYDGMGDVPHRPVKLFSYIQAKTPETIILLRSFFIDLLNFSEKVSPVFTPANVLDNKPLMTPTL